MDIKLSEYRQWRDELIRQIKVQRLAAAMQLNEATLRHYWWLGQDILSKQQQYGWGGKVVEMLSEDLLGEFGADSGYSERNLRYMKQFASTYPDFPILQVPLAELQKEETPILQATLAQLASADGEFVQVPLAQITWYHHITLISKVKDPALRAFYIVETARQGWSRDVMLLQVNDDYHKKIGSAVNNFHQTLPAPDSDLARAMFKDPYNFGFVDMTKVKQEIDLENQLAAKVTDFLLELGKGFAYYGRQKVFTVDGEDCRIDLLMYHTLLHCYVVIELKAVDFQPEFVGKLNYYISVVDEQLRTERDNPTIGLLLCRSKNNMKVEYSLRGMTQPLGVAEYQTRQLMKDLHSSLPSIEELEQKLCEEQ